MGKSTNTDWDRLSPCDLTSTLAYENTKKMFPSKNEDLWKDIAALAVIAATFNDDCSFELEELLDAIHTKFSIEKPLASSKHLRYYPFIIVDKKTCAYSLGSWLIEVAERPVENHLFENQENAPQRYKEAFMDAYGKEIVYIPEFDKPILFNVIFANAQDKMLVTDFRTIKDRQGYLLDMKLHQMIRDFSLDVGFIASPETRFGNKSRKIFIDTEV